MAFVSDSRTVPLIERYPSSSTDGSEAGKDPLNLKDDDGWEDAEQEKESQHIVCLFCNESFPIMLLMLSHVMEDHAFDLVKTRREFALDFYGVIKLVNYIRSEVKSGNTRPTIASRDMFADDKYLQPVLEDDALLFNIDEMPMGDENSVLEASYHDHSGKGIGQKNALARITELEEELQKIQSQFIDYKETVKKVLDDRLDEKDKSLSSSLSAEGSSINGAKGVNVAESRDDDSHYFTSYSYNDIHEVMLKDTIRTDAYRDFIYENKILFKNKVVLDVGCGTGILSMFCAKAGAKKVFAVDNSEIIDKARENIFENGLDGIITCLRGKVEEIHLPLPIVDIIVSEWMGYCLLYEAMLDSVLWARDRYLAPDGLMIPSHMTLHIAALADPDYIASHISFWHSVYGFSMTSMLVKIHDHVLIQHQPSTTLASPSAQFMRLPLHTITTEDLTFVKNFSVKLNQDIDALDGWIIWFDTFFLSSSKEVLPDDARAEVWAKERKGIAFTTGPSGMETHWRQGVLLIDHGQKEAQAWKKGQKIQGQVGYRKCKDNSRELDIDIKWDAEGGFGGTQSWYMR